MREKRYLNGALFKIFFHLKWTQSLMKVRSCGNATVTLKITAKLLIEQINAYLLDLLNSPAVQENLVVRSLKYDCQH